MYGNYQHTVHRVANLVSLRQKRRDSVRELDTDGTERRVLGRSLFRLHRRGLRAQAERHSDVGGERVLLRRFIDIHRGIRGFHELETHHNHHSIDSDHQHPGVIYGNSAFRTPQPLKSKAWLYYQKGGRIEVQKFF